MLEILSRANVVIVGSNSCGDVGVRPRVPVLFCVSCHCGLDAPFFVVSPKVQLGHALAQLVEALRCKPEGRGFDS